jgi:hypothetical protein
MHYNVGCVPVCVADSPANLDVIRTRGSECECRKRKCYDPEQGTLQLLAQLETKYFPEHGVRSGCGAGCSLLPQLAEVDVLQIWRDRSEALFGQTVREHVDDGVTAGQAGR